MIEVVRDEIDKKKAELREKRDRYGNEVFDPTNIANKKAGFRYRGSNKRPERIAYFKGQGYEIVPAADPEAWTVSTKSSDGAKEFGDQVMMRVPMERFIENVARQEIVQEDREKAGIDQAQERINKMYRDDMRGRSRRDIAFDESRRGPERVALRSKIKDEEE